MDALHRQVLPFLLRRMKEDVLQDLPPKIIQDYYCTLSPLQVRNLVIVIVGGIFISRMLWNLWFYHTDLASTPLDLRNILFHAGVDKT